MATPSTPRKRTFQVLVGAETDTVVGRREAVRHAKHISKRTGRPIRVERSDGLVSMEFRRGTLQTYKFETRGRRGA